MCRRSGLGKTDLRRSLFGVALCALALAGMWAPAGAQHAGAFRGSSDDPAINYSTAPLNNVVVDVNRKLQDGSVRFTFDGRSGFMKSALNAMLHPGDS